MSEKQGSERVESGVHVYVCVSVYMAFCVCVSMCGMRMSLCVCACVDACASVYMGVCLHVCPAAYCRLLALCMPVYDASLGVSGCAGVCLSVPGCGEFTNSSNEYGSRKQ